MEQLNEKDVGITGAEEVHEELCQREDARPVKPHQTRKHIDQLKVKHVSVKEKIAEKKRIVQEHAQFTSEYMTLVTELEEWVGKTKRAPELSQAVGTEADVIKKQLKEIETLQDDYIDKRPKLERLKYLQERIVKVNRDDFSTATMVNTKLETIRQPMEEIWMKIEVRQNRLQDALMKSQKFEESFDDFLDLLINLDERLSRQRPVSARLDVVKVQRSEMEQIHNDVMQSEPVYEQLMSAADELVTSTEPGDELEKVKERIEQMKQQYSRIQELSVQKHDKVAEELRVVETYTDDEFSFTCWLLEIEKHVSQLEPVPCEEPSIQRQMNELKEMRKDVTEKKAVLEKLESVCGNAVDNAEVDQSVLQDALRDVKLRYERLSSSLDDRDKKLVELQKLSQLHKQKEKPLDEVLDKVEKFIETKAVLGIDKEKISKEQTIVNVSIFKMYMEVAINRNSKGIVTLLYL